MPSKMKKLSALNILLLVALCCPFLRAEVTQDIDVEIQQKDVDSPESKFEEYEEIQSGLNVEDYFLQADGEKTSLEVEIQDPRLEQQSARFKLSSGKTTVNGSWDQVPHLFSKEARTLYYEVDNETLRLPDPTQSYIQTSTQTFLSIMPAVLAGARPVELKTRTDTGKMNLGLLLSEKMKMNLEMAKRQRTGHKAQAASFGFNNVIEVAIPVDEDTYDTNLSLDYLGKTFQSRATYNFSSFQNKVDSLTWDNPKRLTDRYSSNGYSNGDQSASARMSRPADNIAHNAMISGGLDLVPMKSRLTADVGFNYYYQNESLLPYSINTALKPGATPTSGNVPPFDLSDPANRPADKASAKMITWTQNYALRTNWTSKINTHLKFASIQNNNKTQELTVPGLNSFDQGYVSGTTHNRAYEYRKDDINLNFNWKLLSNLGFGYDEGLSTMKREHREVKETEENSHQLSLTYTPLDSLNIKGKYLVAKREMEEFDTAEQTGAGGEIAGLRRFDIADRDRKQSQLDVQYRKGWLTVGVNGFIREDEFKPGKGDLTGGNAASVSTMYGVQEVKNTGGGVNMEADFNRVAFFAFFSYERTGTHQRSVENSDFVQRATSTWNMRNQDRYQALGIGMDIAAVFNVVDIRLGYDLDRSVGNTTIFDISRASLSKSDPAETRTTKQNLYVQGFMKMKPNVDLKLGYVFEKYNILDFQSNNLDLIEGSGTQASIYLGDSSRDYKAHVVSASVQYKFGS